MVFTVFFELSAPFLDQRAKTFDDIPLMSRYTVQNRIFTGSLSVPQTRRNDHSPSPTSSIVFPLPFNMPRRSIRKMTYEDKLSAAIHARKSGSTYRRAAEKYHVATSTLYARDNTPFLKRGRRCALQTDEEQLIVNFLLRFAKRGAPLKAKHLQEAVKIIVDRLPPYHRILLPFNNKRSVRAFLRAFRKRHADKLSFVKPLRQEASRMAAHNGTVLTHHFAALQNLVEDHGLDSVSIFNLDECGSTPERDMNSQTASRRFLQKRGSRDYQIGDFKYFNRITMMPIISATGSCAPPLFVFKGSRLPCRTVRVGNQTVDETPACKLPPGFTLALRTENGSVDTVNFLNWAYNFVDHVKHLRANNRKVLLIYDAYRAHISLEVLELFLSNNIIVYALPAHSSGKTQPLDTVLFSVFKTSLNTVLSNCAAVQCQNPFDLFDVCAILTEAYHMSFTVKNVKASFCRAGIWPLNPQRLFLRGATG